MTDTDRHQQDGRLDRIASRYATKRSVSAMSFTIEQPSTGFSWGYGDTDRPFFIASITKLYTVALIMQLRDEGAFTLDTPAADLLGPETMRGLVVHDGRDHGLAITVRHLLSHTSGVPDYFEQRGVDGGTFLEQMIAGDAASTFEDYMESVRAMRSRFVPGDAGRAQYCDTNYQLLGRIVEAVTSDGFEHRLRSRILRPLALDATWLFTPDTLDRYDEVIPPMHGSKTLRIPQRIASFPPDGAVVSTPNDQVRFLRAFMGGELFPKSYLPEMATGWKSVFSKMVPIQYGIGLMRYRTPRWQSPLTPLPEMIGHAGAFGNVLFHMPERDLYISGTVNQMRPRGLPYPIMLRLVSQIA